ncbi:TonB-dependent receptor [Pseudoflavitalea sp. G-6-1-2]|uniref:TonB-dependent receptor plug domain-containing protein n=1 Tax=Pseudoflavitalea sp. G-6-1-2 TaxID=2728841 RepID=UPI00146C73AF|nr:TonB-dependent receptor [Pseudoflavitalea sp. G-6-1-2]NML19509.1 TonB-dependent receptor [Pseudoflavitalea sp. G-6-1-2]
MNKKLLSLAALMATLHATAQDSTTVRKQMDEVVVTATKYARKASETGKVITVIDRTVLDRSVGKDLSQLLTEQTGMVVNGATSNPGKDKSIFFRGATSNYTVILINGIPLADPSGTGGAFDLRLIPIDQIERIEILKGAQSTLYGSNAVAGVINIITRNGSKNKPAELYGNYAMGSYNTIKANAGMGGGNDKLRYNIGFTHFETKGISEALDTAAVKSFDKDGYMQKSVNVNLDGEIIDNLRVKPFFRYAAISGNFDAGSFFDSKTNSYDSKLITAGTQVNYKFNKGQVTAQYQFDDVDRISGGYTFRGKAQIAEAFAQYDVHDKVQVLLGFDTRIQQLLDTTAAKKNPEITIYSPYLSFFLKDLNGFYLEAGARLNNHSQFGNHFTYSFNPSYLINKNVKVFANLASAFRAPSLYELYGFYGSNPELKPEKSYTWEIGTQASLINNVLETRVVYFNRRIKDVITYINNRNVNLNEQKDQGLEIEPSINVTKDLNIKLYYSYVDGKVTTTQNGKDSSYYNLVRRPKHAFGATIGYQVTKNLFVSTNVYTYGTRYDLTFGPAPDYAQVMVPLKAYTIWNAYAEYKLVNNRIRIFADLKNITDAKYQEVLGYGTMGTNITAGVAVRL